MQMERSNTNFRVFMKYFSAHGKFSIRAEKLSALSTTRPITYDPWRKLIDVGSNHCDLGKKLALGLYLAHFRSESRTIE